MVRLGPADLESLVALPGSGPFSPMPGRTMTGYATLPPDVIADDAALDGWLEKAIAFAVQPAGEEEVGASGGRRIGIAGACGTADRPGGLSRSAQKPYPLATPPDGPKPVTATRSSPLRISAKVWSRKPSPNTHNERVRMATDKIAHLQPTAARNSHSLPASRTSTPSAVSPSPAAAHRAAPAARRARNAERRLVQLRRLQLRRRLQLAAAASGGGYGASRGPREMFPATCSSCGQETEVPFKPTSGKPVYCSACFAQRRA